MTQPNIVWIFPDEWRHDAFGFAGNEVIQTPNVDALAARGMTFLAAHSESPVCQSARASLLTGMYPLDHGLSDNEHLPSTKGAFPAATVPNFLHALRGAGYRTAEIGKMHFGRGSIGDGVTAWGFDEAWQEHDKYVLWRLNTPYTRHLRDLGLYEKWEEHNSGLLPWLPNPEGNMSRNPRFKPGGGPEADCVPDAEMLDVYIGEQACKYIREANEDKPFFLWVAPIGPHPPFDAPPTYTDLYAADEIPLGPLAREDYPDNEWGRYLTWNLNHVGCASWDEAQWRRIAKYYYGLCSQIDGVVERIVATLAETGRDRDTWIVFSSDHGEMLGDHGLISKRVFFETSVRVPQIIVPPVGQEVGETETGVTQAFDAVATILDLAGADWQVDVPARSLLPALKGESCAREVVFSQIAGFAMAASATQKVVVHEESGALGALYDLAADPAEHINLVDDPTAQKEFAELIERTEKFLAPA